jgi:hypothetical protein
VATVAARSAAEILTELHARGYTLGVLTRVDVLERGEKDAHACTYADKLVVRGREPLPAELRVAVAEHRDDLLAAACVLGPPVGWLQVLVERYRSGHEEIVRRDGWRGPYRVGLAMLAANVAAFLGQHPAHDGLRYEGVLNRALEKTLRV